MTTRSAVIFAGTIPTGNNTAIFTCPASLVVIVKSVYVTRVGGTVGTFILRAARPGYSDVQIWVVSNVSRANAGIELNWVILEPGDELLSTLAEGSLYAWISGTKLPATST